MSEVVANPTLNSSDVEEGELPYARNHQPSIGTSQRHDQRLKHLQTDYRPNNRPTETETDQNPLIQPRPTPSQHPQSQFEYQTIKKKTHSKERPHSPDRKKKSHKSKHHHRNHQPDREREKQVNKQEWRQNENYRNEKKRQERPPHEQEDPEAAGHPPHQYYPPPGYYPPYMYSPVPHPHMYPYHGPPAYMPPGSYPYPGTSMMPPMHMPPPPGFDRGPETDKYQHSRPPTETVPAVPRAHGNELPLPDNGYGERSAENSYKMFPMGGPYMYPYGASPPMGYPGYPPPPYMVYPPESYEQRAQFDRRDEQLNSWRRRQLIDNQKQKVRKVLKHIGTQLKLEILDTIRTVLKCTHHSQHPQNSSLVDSALDFHEDDGGKKALVDRCYRRNIFKIDKWLKNEDDKLRETVRQLLSVFRMEGIKQRIQELKQQQKMEVASVQSETRQLLDRLIISPRQRVY